MQRLLYRMELTPAAGLRVVRIDEWAWHKSLRYRALVWDLEADRLVELLPEARAKSAARRLTMHPGIDAVSRDRPGVFTDAAALRMPQAVQMADRWHLLRNLGDVAERMLLGLSIPPIRVVPIRDCPATIDSSVTSLKILPKWSVV